MRVHIYTCVCARVCSCVMYVCECICVYASVYSYVKYMYGPHSVVVGGNSTLVIIFTNGPHSVVVGGNSTLVIIFTNLS